MNFVITVALLASARAALVGEGASAEAWQMSGDGSQGGRASGWARFVVGR